MKEGFWILADQTKRRLFDKLRKETQRIDYLNYKNYKQSLDEIHGSLLYEWDKILREFKDEPYFNAQRLEGYLLEVLFYYACLKMQALFMDAEILEMVGEKFDEYPPWFEATPFYDIIPTLHHIKENGIRIRKAPQSTADFLLTYVDDGGPTPPALVDVKSRKPQKWNKKLEWQVIAAMRRGFIFQLAYPKDGIKHPTELDEWEVVTPCSNCRRLSIDFRNCSECGAQIFPFTVADAYYEAKELRSRFGRK